MPSYEDFLRSRRYEHAVTINVSSSNQSFTPTLDAIWTGTGGTVTLVTIGGETVEFTVATNTLLPVACSEITESGTTATNMIGLWSKAGG
jgi:hypothetical protein